MLKNLIKRGEEGNERNGLGNIPKECLKSSFYTNHKFKNEF